MSTVSIRWPRFRAASGPNRGDNEFLPAALEILETPPSPILMRLSIVICLATAIALIWSCIGHIDVMAVAQGKVQPAGRVKLVQAVETGKVRDVLVGNGAKVQAGDVLIELDDGEARAEEAELAGTVASLRAEVARRSAAVTAAETRDFTPPSVAWPHGLPEDVVAREHAILVGDLALLSASIEDFEAQRRQKAADRERLTLTIDSQEKLLKIEEDRADLRSGLERQGLGTKIAVFDAMETLQTQRSQLASQQGQLVGAVAALDVLEHEKVKAISSFIADNSQKLGEAERHMAETAQKLAKAEARNLHMTLRAPVSGTIQANTITSIGQVVMPGEEVMRVVPDGVGVEIECYMPNQDVGFIRPGQDAVVKLEAFPFTRYGTLHARVISVGNEAIAAPDAQQQEENPGHPRNSVLAGGAQRMQNLMFPVTLVLDRASIRADGRDISVSNGMAVSVEIKTGSRRLIDYVLSPLVELGSEAMRER